jgi:hypothetical protein
MFLRLYPVYFEDKIFVSFGHKKKMIAIDLC